MDVLLASLFVRLILSLSTGYDVVDMHFPSITVRRIGNSRCSTSWQRAASLTPAAISRLSGSGSIRTSKSCTDVSGIRLPILLVNNSNSRRFLQPLSIAPNTCSSMKENFQRPTLRLGSLSTAPRFLGSVRWKCLYSDAIGPSPKGSLVGETGHRKCALSFFLNHSWLVGNSLF